MVHCTSCGEEHADSCSFCRTCGIDLPGAELIHILREEARQIRLRNGQDRQLSDAERENLATMNELNKQENEQGSETVPQNGEHMRTTQKNTESLSFLMQSMDD